MKTMRIATLFLFFALLGGASPSRVWSEDVGPMMDSAVRMFDQGQYKKAMRLFLNVLNVDPHNAQAKEYRNRCMDKIVEGELGIAQKSKDQEMGKLADTMPHGPSLSTTPPPPRLRPQFRPSPRSTAKPKNKKKGVAAVTTEKQTAKGILEQRDALVEDYRRKILGKESAVWVESKRSEIEVVLYMNRLFMPLTDQLSTDAYPMLEAALLEIHGHPKKEVFLRALDNLSPAVRHTMLDLPARRSAILFSYFVHGTLGRTIKTPDAVLLTLDHLDD